MRRLSGLRPQGSGKHVKYIVDLRDFVGEIDPPCFVFGFGIKHQGMISRFQWIGSFRRESVELIKFFAADGISWWIGFCAGCY